MGAIAGGIQDYATWRNKRLITAVERIRTSQTSQLDWFDQLQSHTTRLQSALLQVKNQFQNAAHKRSVQLAMDAALVETAARQAGPNGRPLNRRPNDSITDLTMSYVQALRQLQSEFSGALTSFPGQPTEVGVRGEDTTDWGLFNMNLNAPEACLDWGKNYGFTPKLLPAGQNPFTTSVYYLSDYSLPLLNNAPQTSMVVGSLATASLNDPIVWAGAWLSQFGGLYRDQPVDFRPESNLGSTSTRPETRMKAGFFFLEMNASSGLAFRCAL